MSEEKHSGLSDYERGLLANNEGMAALANGNFSLAVSLFETSLDSCRTAGDVEGQITALNNLSEALFRVWASKRRPSVDWDAELKAGPLKDGVECLGQDVVLCLEHGDANGAGVTVNGIRSRLVKHAELSEEEALHVFAHFMASYVAPAMAKHSLSSVPGTTIHRLDS